MELAILKSRPAISGFVFGLVMIGNTALANNFNIDVDKEDVAVEATNASLTELLQELEKLTGIPINFVAETDERVTLNVGMTSVENAISKITPNHMIVHENQNGKEVIKELIIIPANSDLASGGSGSAFLPNGNPAPAIEEPQVTQPEAATQADPNQADPNQPSNQPLASEPATLQPPAPDGQVN